MLFVVTKSGFIPEEVRGRRASHMHKLWQGSAASFQPRFDTSCSVRCTHHERLPVHYEEQENLVQHLAMSHKRGTSTASLEPPKLSLEDPGARDLGSWANLYSLKESNSLHRFLRRRRAFL